MYCVVCLASVSDNFVISLLFWWFRLLCSRFSLHFQHVMVTKSNNDCSDHKDIHFHMMVSILRNNLLSHHGMSRGLKSLFGWQEHVNRETCMVTHSR
jgi:hypothetical protein